MAKEVEGDAFLSYAHLDNVGLAEGRKGWVAHLQRALQVRGSQLLGKDFEIWWDPKGHGNDVLSDTLVAQVQRVRALVSVVSPRYIRSEWCLRELAEFCKAAEEQGGVRIRDKSRLFKVLKTPVPLDQQPAHLQPLLGYEFFKTEQDTGRIRELDEIFGPEAQRDFWIKLDDLAHDICAVLQALEEPDAAEAPAGDAVFLAETTSDLKAERDVVRRALQQQGYVVLPAQSLPLLAADIFESVRADLARCRMSVHMVGQHYSLVPEGGTSSLLEIQHELAIGRSASGDFSRLAWIPRGLTASDERQRRVIERLRMDQRVEQNADVLETSLQELQTTIDRWLKSHPKVSAASDAAAARRGVSATLYLVYDQRDQAAIAPWADFLFQHAEIVHPSFEGDEAEIRSFHEENLQSCDGVLIFYGAANHVWLRRKLAEVQKSAGYGRAKGMQDVAVCVIPPDTAEKARFRTHLAAVINQTAGFAPEAFKPFTEGLVTSASGSSS